MFCIAAAAKAAALLNIRMFSIREHKSGMMDEYLVIERISVDGRLRECSKYLTENSFWTFASFPILYNQPWTCSKGFKGAGNSRQL